MGRLLCLGGAALGGLGLLGWISGTPWLMTLVSGQPPMVPRTAVALVLTGVAGALRHRQRAGRVRRALSILAAVVVLALGAGTLVEYVLFPGREGSYLGLPSPPTALALTFLAAAILLFDSRTTARARPSEWLVLSAGFIAFVAMLGQLFGAGPLYRLAGAPVIGVAVPTAIGLLATAVGLLLERPDAGIMRVATSPGPGGILLRRLALAAVLASVVLGLVLSRLLPVAGAESFPLVFAVLAAATTATSLGLLFVTAVSLDRTHEALERGRARTRALIEQASDGIFVADLDGRYTDVNSAACRMLGYLREELLAKTIVDLIPPGDVARLSQVKARLLEGGTDVAEWTLRRKDGTSLPVEVSAKILPDGRWQTLVRDIGERKRAEDQLRQSKERFELALSGADLAAWDWNITTGEVVFNPRWAEMRGVRLDEVAPHVGSWLAGVHPDDLPRVQEVLDDHLQGRTSDYEAEHRVSTRGGAWIWILDRGRVFARDEQGRPTRMVGTELDISARKRADEPLRLAEAKSSGILTISADAIVSIDDQQRITMFNEGAERIFGWSKAEVMSAPLDVLIPERFRAVHRGHVERFLASRDTARRMGGRSEAIHGLRKDGEEFPADAAISKLDVGGMQILTVALRDITEQKRIEREQRFLADLGSVLVSSLDVEDTLLDIARLAVRDLADLCIVDVAPDERDLRHRKVASRDPSRSWICDALVQVPPDRRRPHRTWPALDAEQPVLLQALPPELQASLALDEDQLRALRAVEPCSAIAVPLAAHGKLLGVIVLVSSAPSRAFGPAEVRLADQLGRRAALSIENARLYRVARRAIQARDDILGIVVHDLRSPLGTILMQADVIRIHEADRPGRTPADVIQRAATRMNCLIQDLLDMTCIEAGRLSVEQDRVSVGQILADAVESQRPLAAAASLEVRLEVAPDLCEEVWADRDRLVQVFENLIGNAIKFTRPGGRIVAEAVPRDVEVLFRVTDTGAGIAAEDLPHLFDRFWQVRKSGRHGAGLGLAIVKGIVEAHGGRIWVESTPGCGSTFSFTIPIAPRADVAATLL